MNFQLNPFTGEIVYFSNTSDYEKVEGYLAWKWDLVHLLPVGHTYKSAAPNV